MSDIGDLQREIYEISKSKGWYDSTAVVRGFGDICALIHSEISESYEEFRKGYDLQEVRIENGKPEGVSVEMADAIIRILDWAEHNGVNLRAVIRQKIEYNKTREHRHGGKLT